MILRDKLNLHRAIPMSVSSQRISVPLSIPNSQRNCDTVSCGGEKRGGLARRTINACGNLRVLRKSVRAVSNRPYIFFVLCGQEFLELLSSTELLGRGQSGIVIGLIGDAAHVLDVFKLIVRPDDEH